MIESRWDKCGIWDNRPWVRVNEQPCVLQTRYLRMVQEWHGKAGCTSSMEWTDWQDVLIGSAETEERT